MRAEVGDRLVVRPRHQSRVMEGEILAVSLDGAPPYHVRWLHDGSEARVIPGWDAHVRPRGEPPAADDPR